VQENGDKIEYFDEKHVYLGKKEGINRRKRFVLLAVTNTIDIFAANEKKHSL